MIAFCRTPRGKLSGRLRRNGMEPVNKDQYLLQSLDNALGVLSLFLQEDKLTLSQIAQRSGLNKTVAYRIVYTLEKRGYLNADREGRYRPGIQLAALGARAQMSRAAVELAKPVLTALSREINETVHFTRRYDACRATLLDEILPQQGLIAASSPTRSLLLLHLCCTGSALSVNGSLPPQVSIHSRISSASLSICSGILPRILRSSFPSSLTAATRASISCPGYILPYISLFGINAEYRLSTATKAPKSRFTS